MRPALAPRARGAVRWGIGDFLWTWFAVLVGSTAISLLIISVVNPAPSELAPRAFGRAVADLQVTSLEVNDATELAVVRVDTGERAREGAGDEFQVDLSDDAFRRAQVARLRDQGVPVAVVQGADPGDLLSALLVQGALTIGLLVVVARVKGRGTLSADFGLRSIRDATWIRESRYLLYGLFLAIASNLALAPLLDVYGETERQGVVEGLERSRGIVLVLVAIAVTVLAPVAEELMYRGLLLRSLLRRVAPGVAVLVGSVVFAGVHVLGDPSVGSLVALPALLALGILSGFEAVRSGALSRSVLLHAGFNLTTVFALLVL